MGNIKQIQILVVHAMHHASYAALLQQIVQVVLKDIIYRVLLAHSAIAHALIVHLLYVIHVLLDFIIKPVQHVLNVISQIIMKAVVHVLMDFIMMLEHANNANRHVLLVETQLLAQFVLMVIIKKQIILAINVIQLVRFVQLQHLVIALYAKMDFIWPVIIKPVKFVILLAQSAQRIHALSAELGIKLAGENVSHVLRNIKLVEILIHVVQVFILIQLFVHNVQKFVKHVIQIAIVLIA